VREHLSTGQTLTEKRRREIMFADEVVRARKAAAGHAAHSPKTRLELEHYLVEKGFLPQARRRAIELLTEAGIVNDEAVAGRVVRTRRRKGGVGPRRLVGSGAATASSVKEAALISFGVAGLFGLVLAITTAWWIVLVGLLCIVAAWYYTGGRKPYGYHGLGEVMVFVFFGLVAVMGTTYVQIESFPLASFYAAVGVGALACAILVANNLRDVPTDAEAGKRTLAVVLGDEHTRYLYAFLVAVAVIALLGLWIQTSWLALLALAFLVPAVPAVRTVLGGTTGRGLVPVLQKTGLAELFYAAGMFVGLLLA
jgi:1,4-dihydroxy-2-naphthoate octaprenyltransferase